VKFRQDAFGAFFEAHRVDEWFREKYHPNDRQNKELRRQREIHRRLDAFMNLLVKGWIEVSIDYTDSRFD
jgi:hypothetical protein